MTQTPDPDWDDLEWYRCEVAHRFGQGLGCIRLARTAEGKLQAFWATALGWPVASGFRSGTVQVGKSDWDRMLRLIAEASFWTLPEWIRAQDRSLDGPSFEFTGWLPERKHQIWRYRPTEQDGEVVVRLLRFTDQLLMAYSLGRPCL